MLLRWSYNAPSIYDSGASIMPLWLHVLSICALLTGFLCALIAAVDVTRHPQHVWVMSLVWPITALFAGLLALWAYFRFGRGMGHAGHGHGTQGKPFVASVGIADTHCGAGCTLGDILSEWLVFFSPALAVWFGYRSIFSEPIFAVWILDFICAFIFGIGFQFFTIAPVRGLGFRDGIIAALKSDALTVTCWQAGMYSFVALAQFAYFRPLLGHLLEVNTVEFWFMMQLAMITGFVTAYPITWWLIVAGIKEAM
jgi:hypothetical protein